MGVQGALTVIISFFPADLQVAGAPAPLIHSGGIIVDHRIPTYPGKKPKKAHVSGSELCTLSI